MSDRFLPTPLRRALERTIKEARAVAEEAASDAIRRLGIADAKPPSYLEETGQELRRRLRAHGRALGDRKAADNTQTTDRLIEATAYEHWHRRLFARFLAERHLLRHPEHNVLVTLEDCKEFAAEEGLADEWAAAESYASNMLPAVFRPEDPVLELQFSPEHELKLRQLVLGINAEAFQADDALGWTYQFWRALEKDRVNKAGGKIGAAELPSVTQLFTEPYMVRFLLHNTLGAWWAGKVLAARPELATEAPDEATLRAAVRLPGYEFDMLRFVREGEDAPRWRPAAGTYSGWPREAKALTVIDPCCGSGHFLTEALTILAALRAQDEGLSADVSVTAVLRDNLFGLELDGRCVQIAAFAVALTCWKLGGSQNLPPPHVAWVGAPPPLAKADFMALANGDEDLRRGLGILHGLFGQAPILGSLLEADRGDFGDAHGGLDFSPMLKKLIAKAKRAEVTEAEEREGVIAARGMADAAAILRGRYSLVLTNVPFLGRGRQHPDLAAFIERSDSDAKSDLATAMLSRSLRMLVPGGTVAAVTPQSWLYLGAYQELRRRLLATAEFNLIAALGSGAFETVSGAVVNVALVCLSHREPRQETHFCGIDANASGGAIEKSRSLVDDGPAALVQIAQLRNPEARIILQQVDPKASYVGRYASTATGVQTFDRARFMFFFWEPFRLAATWEPCQSSPDRIQEYGGCHYALLWENGEGRLAEFMEQKRLLEGYTSGIWRAGSQFWGRNGIIVNLMNDMPASLYAGRAFDQNVGYLGPKTKADLEALWAYCSSPEFAKNVRKSDQSLKVTNATLGKIPYDADQWRVRASEAYTDGLPEPYSHDATQWLFHGHPAEAEAGTQLHTALARFAGFRWPAETDTSMRLAAEMRVLIEEAKNLPPADPDGLLPLAAGGGDRPLADRLREYLATCFASEWTASLELRLVAEADEWLDRKAARDLSLEAWLRDRAFRQHCRLFHDRPFLWQVWDGQKDGFSAFLHYHRLNRATLQKLTYTVLGDWIARRKAEGDERRVEAASILQSKLAAILEGEAPYDIFVRWKPLERQPLGWDPDLDDGVRLNIRPWVEAGVLREIPKIKWGVDRGTDPASAPWYELFEGKRNNDHHTTLAEKRAARAAKSATAA